MQDVEQRLHAKIGVRDEQNLSLGALQLDGNVGALEVIALGDLFLCLIDGVVDFLHVDAGRDVE